MMVHVQWKIALWLHVKRSVCQMNMIYEFVIYEYEYELQMYVHLQEM